MIYLDNASTSFPKPSEVLEEISKYLTSYGVTPNRTTSSLAKEAENIIHKTRDKLSSWIGVSCPNNIAFTMNATHGLNLVIWGFLEQGDTALYCTSSHNAVLRPLNHLRKTGKISIQTFTIFENGSFDEISLVSHLEKKPKLLILNHASNVTGTYCDFSGVIQKAKKYNVPVLLDVSQTLGYCSIQAEKEGVDFVVGTGHKALYGPSGVGFLYVKNPDLLPSFMQGGSGGNISLSPYHPNIAPYKYEAGTPNTTSIAGLYGALSFLEKKIDDKKENVQYLLQYLTNQLLELPEVTIYGVKDCTKKVPVVSFTIKDMLPSEIGHILNEQGICVRTGLQCAPLMHQILNTYPTGTIRVGIGLFTKKQEIDTFLASIQSIVANGACYV